jgi:glycerol-3-phosphate dehydrogenase (NAD(P)+)
MDPITVYGSGAWGTTLAIHLARKGQSVCVWDKDPRQRERLLRDRGLRNALPGISLPDSVEVLYEEAVPDPRGEVILLAVPSHGLRWLLKGLPATGPRLWIIATKGLEEETCLTMSQVLADVLGDRVPGDGVLRDDGREDGVGPVVVLAGPSLALEVAQGKPSAVLAASHDEAAAALVQRLFSGEMFRVYTSGDPFGVELGTALKNVIALAAGIADGLGLGQNARGALLTRGLAEIRRLGQALGARPETFLGLAGVGDMVTTCTSPLSRNHSLGEALGRGEPLEGALSRIGMVVEGVRTTRAACTLSDRVGVELPIAGQIYRILFQGVRPAEALHELMTRPLRQE